MVISLATACGKKDSTNTQNNNSNTLNENAEKQNTDKKDYKKYTAFIAMPGEELPDDNAAMMELAKLTGAWCDMEWLTGQTASERVSVLIAGEEYPDFIVGSTGTAQLIEADALIPIDEYFDQYPNIKNYLSESEWNKVRSEDGHIYIIPQFEIIQGEATSTTHNDEAFWIQMAVLEWAGYPQIKTLDEYFDVIMRYIDANPEYDGQSTIGWEICCDDWRYFCLENPPQFLAGYPNDGCCIVDPDTLKAKNFNTIPEAKTYFKKLNEVYNKGYIDPETFTATYDQYISKLATGRVAGMVDQRWNFQDAEWTLKSNGQTDRCYIPLGITLDANTVDHYYSPSALDVSNGLSITKSCSDITGALQFVNDLLSPEAMVLRYWGIEGKDYYVGKDGVFYRDETQRANADNEDYKNKNLCTYDYFPHYEGTLADGINSCLPKDQPNEFYDSLSDTEQRVLDGYGYKTFMDFLSPADSNSDWFPLWSYSNTWTPDTEYGAAKVKMDTIKHEWLPKVIMAPVSEFEATWDKYMDVFTSEVDIEVYEDELTAEVARRIAVAKGE